MMYKPVRVVIASGQREKLKSQIDQNYLSVKIDLTNKCVNAVTLLLTPGQIASIEKARNLGRRKYKTIRMSRKQMENNQSVLGGGGLISLPNYNDDSDAKDHTISTSVDGDDGFYLIKKGHCIKVYPVQDNGLHLKTTNPFSSYDVFEDGLYLKRGNVIESGENIAFAENGSFKNHPVLGWIL